MNNENKQSSKLWVALPAAIIAGVANVTLFFLFMVLYGYVINPGHEDAFYQEAANRFGPYASIIGGMPVFFVTGLVLRRFLGTRALKVGIAAWCIYFALDMAIILAAAADEFVSLLPLIVVSFATKFAAIYFGARTVSEKNEEN